MDFYQSWNFLTNHPIFKRDGFDCFNSSLSIDVVKVNPKTLKIDNKKSKNTLTQIWLETGAWMAPENLSEDERVHLPNGIASHDIELDCGGNTFEDAIIELARLVREKYGDIVS